jgi:hypothetical protein
MADIIFHTAYTDRRHDEEIDRDVQQKHGWGGSGRSNVNRLLLCGDG